MSAKLPINLQDLLHQRTVEGERIEYKAGWNPDATVRTLCAFANDFANLGGGYVVIGQDCDSDDYTAGRAVSRRYRNRRIGEFLKELDLTEGRSTGVPKILKTMAANGSPPPLFETDDDRAAYVIRLPVHPLARLTEGAADQVTPEVTPEVGRVIAVLHGDMSRQDLQAALDLEDAKHFREAYLQPALASGMAEMTLPDAPRSSKQRYRLTALGRRLEPRLF